MILPSATCNSSQAVALLLQVKAKVWAEFMDLPAGQEQQETYIAWNSLNHAIRAIQRQDGKLVVASIQVGKRKPAAEVTIRMNGKSDWHGRYNGNGKARSRA